MTHQEARHIVESSTRFEVRDGQVWLREVRWLRAIERQRQEEAALAASQPDRAEAYLVRAPHRAPLNAGYAPRRVTLVT